MIQLKLLLTVSLILTANLLGLSQSILNQGEYPQVIQGRDGVVVVYTPAQNREIARLIEEYKLLKHNIELYQSLVQDYDDLNGLSKQQINKLDSLTIIIDKKFGLAQKEVWRLEDLVVKTNEKNNKLTEENKRLKKSRNINRLIAIGTASLAGFLIYRNIK